MGEKISKRKSELQDYFFDHYIDDPYIKMIEFSTARVANAFQNFNFTDLIIYLRNGNKYRYRFYDSQKLYKSKDQMIFEISKELFKIGYPHWVDVTQ
ncbi:MAG: hypothetical protein HRT87_03435 [Legionellales bacterium]|nr:hypothetical protein [Legionellales bacterium]